MSEPTQVVTRASAAVLDALNNPRLSLLKNILLVVFLHQAARQAYRLVFVRGVSASWQQFSKELIKWSIKIIRATVPGVDAKIKKEIEKAVKSIESKNAPDVPGEVKYLTLPTEGLTDGVLRGELRRYKGLESDEWKSGKISGAIYHSVESLNQLTTETYGMFGLANPLHPEVFPSVRKMEAEVIAMVLNMHHAPAEACGSVTSGGTESLLMAVKTYRDMARELRGVTEPEMVVPVTIHVAFDKAAQYFGVRIIHIPVDPVTFQVDVRKMDRAINRNTIM
ncbi:pyridoxal phosphate-dependent transferase, partial [Polychytrium aggregatum]